MKPKEYYCPMCHRKRVMERKVVMLICRCGTEMKEDKRK